MLGGNWSKKLKFLKKLGPGVITGASDDDPSGIATYSIAGAAAGYATLWTALITFPLMSAIQEMCARIGLVTGRGLAGIIGEHYPKFVLYPVAFLAVFSITLNIGADIAGLAESAHLVIPVHPTILALAATIIILFLLINFSYRQIAASLKWLTFALFAYILTGIITKQDWLAILFHTFVPTIRFDATFLSLIVAILGTTISPYLFVWQTSEEVEEKTEQGKIIPTRKIQIVTKHELKGMKEDVTFGMFFSNLVMFFIIATTASTLATGGSGEIQTAAQAALALKPLAGNGAFLLFAVGIVGTGMLAIPVLAGAAAYVMSETFGWQEGLSKKFHQAKSFYIVIVVSTALGFLINLLGFNPFKLLFYTAVIYGLISPILIVLILHIANRKEIMGAAKNGLVSNLLGGLALILMTLAAVFLFVTWGK